MVKKLIFDSKILFIILIFFILFFPKKTEATHFCSGSTPSASNAQATQYVCSGTANRTTVTWSASNACGFKLFRYDVRTGNKTTIANQSTLGSGARSYTFNDLPLCPADSYYYLVHPCCNGSNGCCSDSNTDARTNTLVALDCGQGLASCDLPLPGAFTISLVTPACIGPSNPGQPLIDVSWSTSANADLYEIYRQSSGDTNWTFLGSQLASVGTTYRDQDLNLVANTQYRYYIRAKNTTCSRCTFTDSPISSYYTTPYCDYQPPTAELLNIDKTCYSLGNWPNPVKVTGYDSPPPTLPSGVDPNSVFVKLINTTTGQLVGNYQATADPTPGVYNTTIPFPALGYDYSMTANASDKSGNSTQSCQGVSSQSMSAFWNMDESSGSSVSDSVSTNTGTVTGTTIPSAKLGNSRSFIGASSSNINFPVSPRITGSYTISLWLKLNDNQTLVYVFEENGSTNSPSLQGNPSTGLNFMFGNKSKANTGPLAVGQWYNIVMTKDATTSTNNQKVYVNGVLKATVSNSATTDDIGPFTLGSRSGGASPLNGDADEMGIWNKVLTDPEITELSNGVTYNSGTGFNLSSLNTNLVSYWKMDEPSGATVADSKGGDNGTAQAAALVTGGKFGKARNFYADTDHIAFSTTLGNFGTSDFTVSAWFKTVNSTLQTILSKYNNTSGASGWDLKTNTYNSITRNYLVIRSNNSNVLRAYGTKNIADGLWHQVVLERQGSSFCLYVDGQPDNISRLDTGNTAQISGNCYTSLSVNLNNSNPLWLGQISNNISLDPMKGTIDEVGIWNRSLSSSEVNTLYNATSNACSSLSTSKTFSTQSSCVPPWFQILNGSIHSNLRINAPGGP